MTKKAIGIGLGILIGAACRAFGVSLPAPTVLGGALLVMTMTLGYLYGNRFLRARKLL